MARYFFTLLSSWAAIAVTAESQTTANVYIMPDAVNCTYYASVLGANAEATTYVLGRPPKDAPNGCTDGGYYDKITHGPQTMVYTASASKSYTSDSTNSGGLLEMTETWECSLTRSEGVANCKWSYTTIMGGVTSSTVHTTSTSGFTTDETEFIVTAGAEKLDSTATTTATSNTGTATQTSGQSGTATTTGDSGNMAWEMHQRNIGWASFIAVGAAVMLC
ncbi:unnamed protein product [Clonostachys rosea]|uniref:Ig-like domain-containing protein n=1 Tax=Bionectria ochroleuca TaxID=29856 RepID=A0ABY6V0C5_BIOOC|nr:unnamed protein product [Clonostachys rosea]